MKGDYESVYIQAKPLRTGFWKNVVNLCRVLVIQR
jgi:hypothetical protein